jgi:hypothetical protein
MWIKPTSGALNSGQLQLCLSVQTAISTCDLPVNIPAVAQNTWYRVITYATGWEGALSINGESNPGFKSFGIRAAANSSDLTVKFDDFERAAELLGYVARSNKVVGPAGACISFAALQGAVLTDNDCQVSAGGPNTAYENENSTGVTFTGNTSSFSVSTPGTVHLHIDGLASAANVSTSGNGTNAATMFLCTNGGTVTLIP